MAAVTVLQKSKNRVISAPIWPIDTKFGRMTQFDTHDAYDRQKFEISKI